MQDCKDGSGLQSVHQIRYHGRWSRNQTCHYCGLLNLLHFIVSLVNSFLPSSFLAVFSSYFKIIQQAKSELLTIIMN